MKWYKELVNFILQRTIGEPWDEMPFEININWYADLYRDREIAREIVTQGDLDIIAKYLFRRKYFDKTGEWATKHTLEEFNEALKYRMREHKLTYDIIYHKLPMLNKYNVVDYLDKSAIQYRAEFRDLSVVVDSDLHEVMAI